ncbi:CU044_2847 family protein [Streptomyces cinnamoneus]|uniref:Trypsin-co-occurring domain-containing protein n=1 Tax=Streptomyces cinnamoneus TaxID=53446 RepID=A0A918TSY5_STRCJ|nr:CU044_2847 family protein [Streptomyces cinnamoneus]GHC60557.1 hypothetical protein GCM10010507_41920 [Streptomyces cinnamoneus]
MADGITQVRLDDGTVVWARVTQAQELAAGEPWGAYEDSSAARRVADLAGGLSDVVRGVAGSLRMGLAAAKPHEVTVQFGIELSAQAGRVVSLLADGSGKASVTVSLTWTENGGARDGATPGEPAPGDGGDPGGAAGGPAPGDGGDPGGADGRGGTTAGGAP